ncbi:hypothetical protein C8J57DRAFT_1459576 [Mycena rebaudengoi]|nr:hypothetical protein C8J57DRAFT_1459576 [Mycena rebaudengoi]
MDSLISRPGPPSNPSRSLRSWDSSQPLYSLAICRECAWDDDVPSSHFRTARPNYSQRHLPSRPRARRPHPDGATRLTTPPPPRPNTASRIPRPYFPLKPPPFCTPGTTMLIVSVCPKRRFGVAAKTPRCAINRRLIRVRSFPFGSQKGDSGTLWRRGEEATGVRSTADLFEARVNGERKPRIKGNADEIFTILYKHGEYSTE